MKAFHWFKTHRKRSVVFAAIGGLIVLWLLFPPALHKELKAIRRMQADADLHMLTFLEKARANPLPEPDANAKFEDLATYCDAISRGPLAGMPLDFNVNRYLGPFDRLKMDEGYALDYVYCATRNHAYPLLYARLATNAALPDVERFTAALGKETDQESVSNAYLARIRTDGSRQGFIQLAALRLVGGQFYLYWHANYNDTKILSRIPAWVRYSTDHVDVSLFTFSKWGGVARYSVTLKRTFPHQITGERFTAVIPYNCRKVY